MRLSGFASVSLRPGLLNGWRALRARGIEVGLGVVSKVLGMCICSGWLIGFIIRLLFTADGECCSVGRGSIGGSSSI